MTDGILLPGWDCAQCRAFNGTAKEDLQTCRCCGAPRPKKTPEGVTCEKHGDNCPLYQGWDMRRVVLESPFAGDVEANIAYARACIRDCLLRGDAPIASHLLFTQPGILRDGVIEERSLGMRAGFAWTRQAEAVVVYTDRGISSGMKSGIGRAQKMGVPVEYRKLGAGATLVDVFAAEASANDTDADLTPAILASMLVTVGVDVTPIELVEVLQGHEDVLMAAAWARATHKKNQGDASVVVPDPPEWLKAHV
jgi:hypothetical protein